MGKRIEGGATLKQGATFPLRGLGDAGVGFRLDVLRGVPISFTEVSFVTAGCWRAVVKTRADSKNVDADVVSLARSLDERIKGVLSGKVQ